MTDSEVSMNIYYNLKRLNTENKVKLSELHMIWLNENRYFLDDEFALGFSAGNFTLLDYISRILDVLNNKIESVRQKMLKKDISQLDEVELIAKLNLHLFNAFYNQYREQVE